MAIEGAQKARWTMDGPIPEVTKLPKPWKLFPKEPYPPCGCEVLVTDGNSVWADKYFNDNYKWRNIHAWRDMPKTPNLGLVWPERLSLSSYKPKSTKDVAKGTPKEPTKDLDFIHADVRGRLTIDATCVDDEEVLLKDFNL